MIKAVIFDMDGVLIEAKDWHYEALNRALRLFGHEISRYAHLSTYDGLPTSRKLEMLSIESELPRALHGFINEMKQLYTMEMVHTQCKPTFAHELALSTLKSRGYKMAVASNSIKSTVVTMMEKANLASYLELMLSNEDVSKPKPDPEIYLAAITGLGLSPQECLIVEDNDNGVKAALASGAHLLRVRSVQEVNIGNIEARIEEVNHG